VAGSHHERASRMPARLKQIIFGTGGPSADRRGSGQDAAAPPATMMSEIPRHDGLFETYRDRADSEKLALVAEAARTSPGATSIIHSRNALHELARLVGTLTSLDIGGAGAASVLMEDNRFLSVVPRAASEDASGASLPFETTGCSRSFSARP